MNDFHKSIVERRMVNWGLSLGDSMAGNIAPGFRLFSANQVRTGASIPCLYGEADETDRVLRRLLDPQRRVLTLQYVLQPPIAERHRSLGLTNGSYYRLVDSAHIGFLKELKTLTKPRPFATRW